ncbi:MAG: DNA repair protein RecN [Blastocatellia bacterium]
MLSLLKIENIALIGSLAVEFGPGLNLLTGETGSGKSIIVDSLSALTGERISSDLIKEGTDNARIEGLFTLNNTSGIVDILDESGIDHSEPREIELIVRRDLSTSGRNRIFINNQLVTAALLKKIGPFLVDIHGQGEQATLFDPITHRKLLDDFAEAAEELKGVGELFAEWTTVKSEIVNLEKDEADKLQLIDILKFQVSEIERADLREGETEELEEEKRRLNNIEKLSSLSEDAYRLLYEDESATIATLDKAARKIEELAEFEPVFRDYLASVQSARTLLEDLGISARDYRNHLEFSPERLAEIEDRLAELSRITRKYGGTAKTALAHLQESSTRLQNIETAELRLKELDIQAADLKNKYLKAARILHDKRVSAAKVFEKKVEENLKAVALEKAKFTAQIDSPDEEDSAADSRLSATGFDRIEFLFSANPGESPKPLSKVASGGESSRLMLILKTTANAKNEDKTAVFDEIDAGIGGRVAKAVGAKLKRLAESQQVLCVTHQPQVASQADRHFLVEKKVVKGKTEISIRRLGDAEKIEEIARMLAGEKVTEAARANAREMLAAAG